MSDCKKCVEEGNWPACSNFIPHAFKKNQCKTCFHLPSDHGIQGVNEEPVKKPTPQPKSNAPSRLSKREEPPKEEPVKKPTPIKVPIKAPSPKQEVKAPVKLSPKQPPKKIVEEEIIEDDEIIEDEEIIEEEVIEEEEVVEEIVDDLGEGRMKAVVKDRDGGPEVLVIETVDKPKPNSKQVLVKVMAAGVNRADCMQRKGNYPPPEGESDIIGLEVAGIIEEVGREFSDLWKKGDRVCGLVAGGGYAQYCVVHGDMLMEIPDNMSFEIAAGIPETFITAYQLLYFYGGLREKVTQSNQTILIHAGASGVGTAAIQLAKLYNNTVIATTSSNDKIELCKKLGSDYQINYKTQNWEREVKEITNGKGVDILIDCIGASYWASNVNSMAMDGRLIVYGLLGGPKVDQFDISLILRKRLHIFGTTLRNRDEIYKVVLCQEFFEKTQDFFDSGKLRPVIDKTFSYEDAHEAHEYMEENRTMGKIVLTIKH